MSDDDWASQRQMVPIRTEVIDNNGADVGPGVDAWASVCVDWNSVELDEPTDLIITRMADTEMAKILAFQ
jgi:hypothetical protein